MGTVKKQKKQEYKFLVENLHVVTQFGLTMAGCIIFCFGIGYFLDKWLGTKGLFITIFILLGIAGGGYTVYRQIQEVLREEEKEGNGKGGERG